MNIGLYWYCVRREVWYTRIAQRPKCIPDKQGSVAHRRRHIFASAFHEASALYALSTSGYPLGGYTKTKRGHENSPNAPVLRELIYFTIAEICLQLVLKSIRFSGHCWHVGAAVTHKYTVVFYRGHCVTRGDEESSPRH